MTASVNTIAAESLGNILKSRRGTTAKAAKKMESSVFKNPERALEIGVSLSSAAATRSLEAD